jgi:dihydrodipicolinate synthase/N-acetylneuraminate lyase
MGGVGGAPSGLRFGVSDLKGVIAVPPTPATPEAASVEARDTVDLAETERMIRALIDAGVDGILTNGTLGEMSTLTLEEWRSFAEVVAETVRSANDDLPLFIGATTLGTRDTLDRIAYLRDLGVRGVFLGRPFWSQLGIDSTLGFYQSVAEAFPDMSFVLYDNPEAFKGPLLPPVYARLAKIPGIIGVKYRVMTPLFRSDVMAVAGDLRIMPIEVDWLVAQTMFPEVMEACWSSSVLCGPEPVIYLRQALEDGDVGRARWVTDRMEWAYEKFLARRDFAEFSKYNIPFEKVRFDEAGFVRAGPSRPPYEVMPEAYDQDAREHARRWREVVDEVVERGVETSAAAAGRGA